MSAHTQKKPVASREAFGVALAELGEAHPEVVVLDADLAKSTKSLIFGKRFPDRFFEMGIAEQNMVGVAAGLGLSGKNAFCCSFACFVVGRFETIKISVAYGDANVKIVGTHAGVGIGEDGYSQMGLEDLALMRSLANMRVFQPADEEETKQLMAHLCATPGPAYLRLTRQGLRHVHDESYVFEPGKIDVLREGSDLAIVATGGTVGGAVGAAERLAEEGVEAAVINLHTIKPIDTEGLRAWAAKVPVILTVEDHNVLGGMGSAVAEVVAEVGGARVFRHGIYDVFGESGTPSDLYRKFKLDSEGIAEVAREKLGR